MKLSILKELFKFLIEQRKWWLIPIVFSIIIFGLLVLLSSSSTLAPFVYTLF